jgi:translation elongation factor EF-1beta
MPFFKHWIFIPAKLVPVGYGINKLQVMCVVEDEKVSIDELCEQIQVTLPQNLIFHWR